MITTAILYFDYLVTLPDEIRRIWFSRFTGATVLFLLNRYVPIIGYIPILLSMVAPPWDIVVCRFSHARHNGSNVLQGYVVILSPNSIG